MLKKQNPLKAHFPIINKKNKITVFSYHIALQTFFVKIVKRKISKTFYF